MFTVSSHHSEAHADELRPAQPEQLLGFVGAAEGVHHGEPTLCYSLGDVGFKGTAAQAVELGAHDGVILVSLKAELLEVIVHHAFLCHGEACAHRDSAGAQC
jgi:hypothetical protein